ncbi:hypothetical protein Q1695_012828 [Nippostrongylus brasiliensis]|nr:hypothetical protein Q1695_012828 [Nippostrongylus brasiliensis]
MQLLACISALTLVSSTSAAVIVSSTTPSSGCVDKINPRTGTSDCPRMKSYCTNSAYQPLIFEQCPYTCGMCTDTTTPGGSSGSCFDLVNPSTGVSDCPKMNDFCFNSAYVNLMKQQCRKTCGYC